MTSMNRTVLGKGFLVLRLMTKTNYFLHVYRGKTIHMLVHHRSQQCSCSTTSCKIFHLSCSGICSEILEFRTATSGFTDHSKIFICLVSQGHCGRWEIRQCHYANSIFHITIILRNYKEIINLSIVCTLRYESAGAFNPKVKPTLLTSHKYKHTRDMHI